MDTLTENGPPPYTSMLDYEPALSYEDEVYPYSHAGNSEGSGQMGENIFVGEYTLLEQLHIFGGFMDTFFVLYPQIQDIDLRTSGRQIPEGKGRAIKSTCGPQYPRRFAQKAAGHLPTAPLRPALSTHNGMARNGDAY